MIMGNAFLVFMATSLVHMELERNCFATQPVRLLHPIPGPRSLKDRIAIIGAGPSGIHMAHLLKEKGFTNVEILEKEGYLGGKSWTVNHRGVPHEMGTVYLTPDYESNVIELVNRYTPGDLIPLQQASVWLDRQRPVTYADYLARYALAFCDTNNVTLAIGTLNRALNTYIAIHRDLFGVYEGEMMPEPSSETLALIGGTFAEFLSKNKLEILAPLFYAGHTMQGYGHIDEIAALYGLMWNTPRFMMSLLKRLSGDAAATGLYLLKRGFSHLWKTIVEKDGIKIIYNVHIQNLWRDDKTALSWLRVRINGGSMQNLSYNYVIWSPNMKTSLDIWQTQYPEENLVFSKLSHWYFTTAIMDSQHVERGPSPIDYWFDNMNHKREHSVWAQRDSYAAINSIFGPTYESEGIEGNETRITVVYLMGRNPPISERFLKSNVLKHFAAIRGTNFKFLHFKTWDYFPRFAPADIEKGILWQILKMQGKYGMWYIGSSVSFESAKSMIEYNKMLLRNMVTPGP